MSFKDYITEVPDFPVEGVNFKDISPLLSDEGAFDECIECMGEMVEIPDYWIGIDARGFIFASALSIYFGGGIVMCRKAGKLPPTVFSHSYKTEYSEDTIQIKQGSGTAIIVDLRSVHREEGWGPRSPPVGANCIALGAWNGLALISRSPFHAPSA